MLLNLKYRERKERRGLPVSVVLVLLVVITVCLTSLLLQERVSAANLDIEEVTEIRVAKEDASIFNREMQKILYIKEGGELYVIESIEIRILISTLTFYKLNTTVGEGYILASKTKSKEVPKIDTERKEKEFKNEGKFTITTYCPCSSCNGQWVGQAAKCGEDLEIGKTIAVDPKIIPIDTWVEIEGVGMRKACDTGSAIKGKKIDLLIGGHSKSDGYGTRKNVEVRW